VSLHEPVFVKFQVNNHRDTPIELDLGKDRKTNFLITFQGPNGQRGDNLRLSWDGIGAGGEVSISPEDNYQQDILMNEWIDFRHPGRYDIEIHLDSPARQANGNVVAQVPIFRGAITIGPFDAHRLETVCASLEKRIENASTVQPALDAAVALSLVKHDVAVPYLEKSLYESPYVGPIVTRGLERIGDRPAAIVLMNSLSRLPSDTVDLAKTALSGIRDQTADSSLRQEIQRALETASKTHDS
jgi:hypothetical protein